MKFVGLASWVLAKIKAILLPDPVALTARILSLNTWKNDGEYDRRLPLMTSELLRLQPQIILLQECFLCSETGDDTAASIAKEIGMDYVFAPARQKPRRHRGESRLTQSGLAILSHGVFDSNEVIPLPSSDVGGERIALSVVLELEGMRIRVVCSHFSHIRAETSIRARQVALSMTQLCDDRISDFGVLGGDFNCLPDGPEIEEALSGIPVGMTNALPSQGCSEGTSLLPPSSRPLRQIDQIWLSDPSHGELLIADAGVDLNRPIGDPPIYPSDHAAVWLDVVMSR